MEGTSGSTNKVTQNTIIYLALLAKMIFFSLPILHIKLKQAQMLQSIVLDYPQDHSIWAVDKTSAGDRLINDDTCTSFLQLKEIKGPKTEQENMLKEEIYNRLAQLRAFKIRDELNKTDEETKDRTKISGKNC